MRRPGDEKGDQVRHREEDEKVYDASLDDDLRPEGVSAGRRERRYLRERHRY